MTLRSLLPAIFFFIFAFTLQAPPLRQARISLRRRRRKENLFSTFRPISPTPTA